MIQQKHDRPDVTSNDFIYGEAFGIEKQNQALVPEIEKWMQEAKEAWRKIEIHKEQAERYKKEYESSFEEIKRLKVLLKGLFKEKTKNITPMSDSEAEEYWEFYAEDNKL